MISISSRNPVLLFSHSSHHSYYFLLTLSHWLIDSPPLWNSFSYFQLTFPRISHAFLLPFFTYPASHPFLLLPFHFNFHPSQPKHHLLGHLDIRYMQFISFYKIASQITNIFISLPPHFSPASSIRHPRVKTENLSPSPFKELTWCLPSAHSRSSLI